jgi:colicin import membrane protein
MMLRTRHLVLAALLHVALFALLVTGVQCSSKIQTPPVIQGVLINPAQVPKPPAAPPRPQPKIEAPVQDLQAQQQAERQIEQEKQQALARQQAEQQKLQAQQEVQRQAQELKKQQEAQAQRQAEEEQRQAQAQRQEQLRQQAQAEAQARKALEEKKKAELIKQQQAQRLAELQQQLGIEAGQLQQQIQNEWVTQIQAALHRAFVRPPGVSNTLSCKISIQLAPTGAVQSASIVNSSGNTLFDNSVLAAVYKASPLPLPRDPALFQPSIVVNFVP